MNAILSWRKTRRDELSECLRLHPAKNGAETLEPHQVLDAWRTLLGMTYAARSSVIELQRKSGTEIVGFGFGVFVKQGFAEAELRNPAPGLNSRIIESIFNRQPVVATYEEVRDANTRSDLVQVILDASWKEDSLHPEQIQEVRVFLARSYQELHAGYRLSKMLSELVDERDFLHAQGLRPFRIVDRFEEYRKAHPDSVWNPNRALSMATAESMRGDPGSVAAELFYNHRDPRFGLTREEQELLEVALDGVEDATAAKVLFVTLPAIKRRWQNIFHRIGALMPDLCPPDGEGTRGIQKRQRILSYIRNHPEEIRPFDLKKILSPQR